MIRIATAECFTHGIVGREIHAFSRGYSCIYPWTIDPCVFRLSLVAALFIPTLSGVHRLLNITPIPPCEVIDDIKVFDQETDEIMALKMAEAVRSITMSDIGIGTTAGIGRGGIAIVTKDIRLLTVTDVEADLRFSNHSLIIRRQESGIQKTLQALEAYLTNTLPAFSGYDPVRFP